MSETLRVQLSKLPATFPDGSPLDRRAYPSTLNCLVRKYFKNLREPPPFFYEVPIAYILLFGISMLTLILFWCSHLKLHSWCGISLVQSLMVSVALNSALYHAVLCMVVMGEKGWRENRESWKDDWMWRTHFTTSFPTISISHDHS